MIQQSENTQNSTQNTSYRDHHTIQPFQSHKNYIPIYKRSWVPNIDVSKYDGQIIRVVTYNILCDSLLPISTQISDDDLTRMPYLDWENRRRRILDELKNLDADIVCIQEFERDEIMIEELGKISYDVIIILF